MAPASSCSSSSLEILKMIVKRCAVQPERIVIRDQQKSCSYAQLVSSFWRISDLLLCEGDLSPVR